MSKASTWVADLKVAASSASRLRYPDAPEFRSGAGFLQATVIFLGWDEGAGLNIRRNRTMSRADALRLAHFILDTFGEDA